MSAAKKRAGNQPASTARLTRGRVQNALDLSLREAGRVLIVARCRDWAGIARLPRALQGAGFKVAVLCYPDAFLAKTRYVDWFCLLKEQEHTNADFCRIMARAIADWKPGLVLPGDDLAVRLLHEVAADANTEVRVPKAVARVIRRSLGASRHFEATANKNATCRVAAELGLLVPPHAQIRRWQEAERFATRQCGPVVLKAPHGWSGIGVKICANKQQRRAAFKELCEMEGIQTGKDDVGAGLGTKVESNPAWSDSNSLSIQRFIVGQPGMYSAVAVRGEVLAGYCVLKEHMYPESTGPSAVVRFIEHPEMTATGRVLIKHFEYTGFIEFCFMVEDATGSAFLLECNPRPAPIVPLGTYAGIDLCQALFGKLNGAVKPTRSSLRGGTVVAIFPQEWRRDPASRLLRTEYHDVPWDDPDLLQALISN